MVRRVRLVRCAFRDGDEAVSAPMIRGKDRPSDWMAKGACRGTQRNPTRALCASRPVRWECLEFGLGESAEMLYGGFSEFERRQLLRQTRNDRGKAVALARESEHRTRR